MAFLSATEPIIAIGDTAFFVLLVAYTCYCCVGETPQKRELSWALALSASAAAYVRHALLLVATAASMPLWPASASDLLHALDLRALLAVCLVLSCFLWFDARASSENRQRVTWMPIAAVVSVKTCVAGARIMDATTLGELALACACAFAIGVALRARGPMRERADDGRRALRLVLSIALSGVATICYVLLVELLGLRSSAADMLVIAEACILILLLSPDDAREAFSSDVAAAITLAVTSIALSQGGFWFHVVMVMCVALARSAGRRGVPVCALAISGYMAAYAFVSGASPNRMHWPSLTGVWDSLFGNYMAYEPNFRGVSQQSELFAANGAVFFATLIAALVMYCYWNRSLAECRERQARVLIVSAAPVSLFAGALNLAPAEAGSIAPFAAWPGGCIWLAGCFAMIAVCASEGTEERVALKDYDRSVWPELLPICFGACIVAALAFPAVNVPSPLAGYEASDDPHRDFSVISVEGNLGPVECMPLGYSEVSGAYLYAFNDIESVNSCDLKSLWDIAADHGRPSVSGVAFFDAEVLQWFDLAESTPEDIELNTPSRYYWGRAF